MIFISKYVVDMLCYAQFGIDTFFSFFNILFLSISKKFLVIYFWFWPLEGSSLFFQYAGFHIFKGGLISESIFTCVPPSKNVPNYYPQLFTLGWKLEGSNWLTNKKALQHCAALQIRLAKSQNLHHHLEATSN